MQLNWIKCQGDVWCKLDTVNLGHSHFENMHGVYIIWHGGNPAHTVRIGKGYIRDRLQSHRNDPEVQAYAHLGLYVTWASVPGQFQEGVEVYLGKRLTPKVGERFPQAIPTEVNLPW